MNSPSLPPGRKHELDLAERLEVIQLKVQRFQADLPHLNDAELRPRAEALVRAAARIVRAHINQPGPEVASDLAGLLSATNALPIPARDPELGGTDTLRMLRGFKGNMFLAVKEALESAEVMGLRPRNAVLPRGLAFEVPRAENEGALSRIVKQLDDVVERLDALDEAKTTSTGFVPQEGLINFYVGSMHIELDVARLQLTVGDKTVDFEALARAVEVMTELTLDFVATVRAWIGKVSETVSRIAEEVRTRVRKVSKGVATAAQLITRREGPPRNEYGEPIFLRSAFDPNNSGCDTEAHFADENARRRFLQLRVDCVYAPSAAECSGRLIDIRGPRGILFQGSSLTLPFAPFEHHDAISKLIRRGIPEYLNVLAISEHNQVMIVTHQFIYPIALNQDELFRETGTYTLKIAITSTSSAPEIREFGFLWTGDWRTASLATLGRVRSDL